MNKAVILSEAIGNPVVATCLKARPVSIPSARKPAGAISTISTDRLAKIRVG